MSNALMVFCYSLVAYGACNVIVFGSGPFKVFERIRDLANRINEHFGLLFSCMMCMPTNFGLICSLVNWFFIPVAFTPFNIAFYGHNDLWWLAMLCDGAFTSGVVWIIHHIEEFFENLGGGSNNTEDNNDVMYVDE